MLKPEYNFIVRHVEGISARIDRDQNMIEYIGVGSLLKDVNFKHHPKDHAEGENFTILKDSGVTYVLRQYTCIDEFVQSHICTVLTMYFVKGGESYKFSDSISCNIDTAAYKWGLENYR